MRALMRLAAYWIDRGHKEARKVLADERRAAGIQQPLPTIVLAALETATIVPRIHLPSDDSAHDDAEDPRAVVFFAGRNAYLHDDENSARVLGHMFPELDGEQLERAVQHLERRVLFATVEKAGRMAEEKLGRVPGMRRWNDWKPYKKITWD